MTQNTLPPTEIIDAPQDCMIISTRVFNVPIEKMFRGWTEPAHLANWWGPKGFTNTFHEFDLRPGGKWRLTMHGPEKGNYQNESVFIKVEVPSKLVWNRISQPIFQVVAHFETVSPGKTNVVFKMIFQTTEECNKVKGVAVGANEENFDRLEEELSRMS